MNSIGGYFGLELRTGGHYHPHAIKLNTSRNCLEYILKAKQYKKIYIPYYTCQAMLEPIKKCNIDYEFYSINVQLEPVKEYHLSSDEVFLYTNYFGIKDETVEKLAGVYGKQLIVDNAHAFYSKPIAGIDTIYSARKFFGVADGGYLYTDTFLGHEEEFECDMSHNRMSHLLKRIELTAEQAYAEFIENDKSLEYNPIRKMSKLTERILAGVDYESIRKKRRENFMFLDAALKKDNLWHIDLSPDAVPMVYPFYNKLYLWEKLIANKIYVASYWPNVREWCNKNQIEYTLMNHIIPFPVDQRYGTEDLQHIIDFLAS